MCVGWNQQKSAIDNEGVRGRSGDSTGCCFRYFYGGSWHVAAKFVLRLLSEKQKEFRAEVAQDSLETSNNDPEKAQSFQWMLSESPHPKKVQQSQNIKTMSTVFFIVKVFSHHKYASPGQTVNKEYYIGSFLPAEGCSRKKTATVVDKW
jgi:hypothetical protein